MQSFKWEQVGKLILSFATFCYVFPHALEDFGKVRTKDAKSEAKSEAKCIVAS